ncbi:MAG: hypothetical protein AB1816_04910 [Bacillota bacterium]
MSVPRWLDNWMIYEITPQERDELIEKLARLVKRFGLYTPAIFVLETGKDLSWLGSQFMHLFSPVITIVWNDFQKLAFLLEDKQNVERLIRRIEEMSEEEKKEAHARGKKRKAPPAPAPAPGHLVPENTSASATGKPGREKTGVGKGAC